MGRECDWFPLTSTSIVTNRCLYHFTRCEWDPVHFGLIKTRSLLKFSDPGGNGGAIIFNFMHFKENGHNIRLSVSLLPQWWNQWQIYWMGGASSSNRNEFWETHKIKCYNLQPMKGGPSLLREFPDPPLEDTKVISLLTVR